MKIAIVPVSGMGSQLKLWKKESELASAIQSVRNREQSLRAARTRVTNLEQEISSLQGRVGD